MTLEENTRQPAAPTGQLLDSRTVARMLGVHPNTVANMTASGELRAVRIGPRLVRYRLSDIEMYIEAQTDPPRTTAA